MGYNFGVGREAPTFSITAADGSEINLKQYRGDWFPVLVFLPSQDPATPQVVAQLSSAADAFWGLRGQLIGLCDASPEAVRELAAGVEGLSFPLLPDDGRVAKTYGALTKSGDVRPMAFIVDRAGKVVWSGDGAAALKPARLQAAFRQVAR